LPQAVVGHALVEEVLDPGEAPAEECWEGVHRGDFISCDDSTMRFEVSLGWEMDVEMARWLGLMELAVRWQM